MAEQLAANIAGLHRLAYQPTGHAPRRQVLSHWRQTPTRSIRLLVRLLINELDLGIQNGEGKPG